MKKGRSLSEVYGVYPMAGQLDKRFLFWFINIFLSILK